MPGDIRRPADSPRGAVVSYALPTAVDDVDGPVGVLCSPPPGSTFPIGTTTVTCSATDRANNSRTATFHVQIVDTIPPADVSSLQAFPGDAAVQLTWKRPADGDFDHVTITRSLADGTQSSVVYAGSAEAFTDRGVKNWTQYRYLVVAVDRSGNRSRGLTATAMPRLTMLRAPRDGARLRRSPKLTWRKATSASYYNVQLFRGTAKILSAWPKTTSVQLHKTWNYRGKRFRLFAGRYTWYVWPGFGNRAAAKYGDLLGFSSFVIVR